MFSFFKRSDSVSKVSANRRASQLDKSKSTSSRIADFLSPLPVPEVTEGNLDSDWAMWEDSVLEQDSHLPLEFADTRPSQFEELSPEDLQAKHAPISQVIRHSP